MSVQAVKQKTPDERKAILSREVANAAHTGWRIESQSDFQAIVAKGRHVRHILHAILTLLTLGLWAIIWIAIWLAYHERRRVIEVDAYGNVQRSGGF